MKRNVFGVAPRVVKAFEHTMCARIIERVDNDGCATLAVWVGGKPGGDGISCAFVIVFIREVMFFPEVVVEKDYSVLALLKPSNGLSDVARHVQNVGSKFLSKPGAAHLVVFNNQNAPQGNNSH
jgi:hypothetical protein